MIVAGIVAPARPGEPIEVRSPGVGAWEPACHDGQLVRPGDRIGWLHVLGVVETVTAPPGATGIVVGGAAGAAAHARVPVDHGARLYLLDPARAIGADAARTDGPARADGGLAFVAPTSGRFYSRPGPGKPPFVAAGDVVRDGQTVCLLEVMKTFNRVVYEARAGLPPEARVVEVVAADEADVDAGAVLLRLEALS